MDMHTAGGRLGTRKVDTLLDSIDSMDHIGTSVHTGSVGILGWER
jgi:hypothetical protein